MSILEKIAEELGISVEELVAVIYISDANWTIVQVYGSEVVSNTVQASYEWAEVTHHSFDELTKAPAEINQNFASEVFGEPGCRIITVLGLNK